ncbi:M16 family metallopeptidase [Daejeonella oryzae]|uniref:M16 family metallopeptidase n=1 Tax=Daejeonella oryzae TaxID=1122943 RepID=UPI00041E2F8A|nr:pitrilysin family protein [Daejeonella oryzae]
MLNRALAPEFGQIENIKLIEANPFVLDNGLKTFIINGGEQDLIRIEFVFSNINWDAGSPLQSFATNTLLNDGTSEFSAAQIADRIDFYGAFLQTEYNYDQASVTLYTLNKHLSVTLPIVKAIITDSIFPQVEIDTFILNQKQKLSVNLEKNDFIGRKVFNETLFGNTLYGYDISAKDYDQLNREQLTQYYKSAYQPANCTIILSGKVSDKALNEINSHFGKDWKSADSFKENNFDFTGKPGAEIYIEKPDALQSAIRIGQLAINRNHTDFPGFQVLNTILGGYFGSRLMANIREDKGYTYGIGSAVVSLKNAGYFFIASEVGADVTASAMEEIRKEINILQNNLVSDEELSLVRNYMLGSMLGSLENALSHADKFKNIYFSNLGYDYYDRYIQVVRNITAKDVLELANKYLNWDDFQKVVVGKK